MRSDDQQLTFSGRFSDGETAVSFAAEVEFGGTSLFIRPHGDTPERIWPYGSLVMQKPLKRRARDVLLRMAQESGATLFVADRSFASALLKRAPHLGSGAHIWRFSRPALAILAVIALAVGSAWVFDISPARTLAGLMPEKARKAAGQHIFEGITASRPLCTDPGGREAIQALVSRLTVDLAKAQSFDVRLVDWGLVNAFALPGNTVVLTRGLIEKARGPDEIAGVLAHEIGHGLRRHPETAIVRVLGISVATKLVFAGSSETLSSAGVLLIQLKFTRSAEREADSEAVALLKAAGISARPLANFFARLNSKGPKSVSSRVTRTLAFLSTHPPLEEREQMIARIGHYASRPALTPAQWTALRSACGTPPKPASE